MMTFVINKPDEYTHWPLYSYINDKTYYFRTCDIPANVEWIWVNQDHSLKREYYGSGASYMSELYLKDSPNRKQGSIFLDYIKDKNLCVVLFISLGKKCYQGYDNMIIKMEAK